MFHGLVAERHQPAADAGIGPDRIEPAVFGQRLVDEGLDIVFRTRISITASMVPPAALTRFAVSLTPSLRSTAISLAPSFVNNSDAARPMPLPAPVMMTICL